MWEVELSVWTSALYVPRKHGSYFDDVTRFLESSRHCCLSEEEVAVLLLVQPLVIQHAMFQRMKVHHLRDWSEGHVIITHSLGDCWKAVTR